MSDSDCVKPKIQVFDLVGRDTVVHVIDRDLVTLPNQEQEVETKCPSFQVHNLTGRNTILAVLNAELAFVLKNILFDRKVNNPAIIAFAHQLENAYEEEAA